MTDITVNPCEEEVSGSISDGGNSEDEGSSDLDIPIITLDRVSFPERRITTPVPVSERKVTLINSINFSDVAAIRTDNTGREEPLVRYPDSSAAAVLEIDAQDLEDAEFDITDLNREVLADRNIATGFELAQSKGLIDPNLSLTEFRVDMITRAGAELNAFSELLAPIVNFANLKFDHIRHLAGLVFVDNPELKTLEIANKDQFNAQFDPFADRRAENNLKEFGCPFVVLPPENETLTRRAPDPAGNGADSNAEIFDILGISAFKTADYILEFIPHEHGMRLAQQTVLNNFKGEDDSIKTKNFADLLLNTHFGYSSADLGNKTSLTAAQSRALFKERKLGRQVFQRCILKERDPGPFTSKATLKSFV